MRLIQLGNELKRLRSEAGITREEVEDATGISSPTLSRIENAKTTVSADTVVKLLSLYGRTDRSAALVALAKEAQKRDVWLPYRDILKGPYVGLESEADEIFTFEPLLVPGLAQIPEYIRALVASATPASDRNETEERRIQARMARQALLTRPSPPTVHFVIGEAVLHQLVGGAEVMSRQISHLWELGQRANATVQVLPFSAGAHRSLDGGFTELTYREAEMVIAYAENPAGGFLLENMADLAEINLRKESLRKVALSSKESAEMLRTFADRIRE